jgi:hypothetical protein
MVIYLLGGPELMLTAFFITPTWRERRFNMLINNVRETKAVSIYLNDLYHYRDVKRKFSEVMETYDKNNLLCITKRLWQRRKINDEEKRYLCQRITGWA